jgi:CelD/BcsL family acetyltransferase involved in cellulose biosynthesis
MLLHVAYGHEARVALDGAWDELVRVQERPNPTMLAGWLRAMIERDTGRLVAVRVVDGDGHLLAAALVSTYRPLGRLGPHLARWPGDPSMWFDPDILVRHGHESAGLALVDALLREVHALHVPCLEGSALDTAARARDPGTVHRWSPTDGWMSPIPVPRDGYARTRIARDVRAAERKHARIETTYAVSPSAISEALERLFDLHYAFWSKRSDWIPRFSATSEARAVHRAAVDALARSGDAYITEVRENGEVAASGLALRAGSGLVCHTSATRRDTQLRAPGHARMLATMDHAASLGVAWVDLGPGAGGPASTKHRIGALPVPIQRTICARSRVWLVVCRSLLDGRDRARSAWARLLRIGGLQRRARAV